METLDKNFTANDTKELSVNGSITSYVQTASKWTVIISVCLFLIALSVIGMSIKTLSDLAQVGDFAAQNPTISLAKLIAFLKLFFAGVLIFPAIFLIRFTISAKSAFRNLDQGDFDFAIKNAKNTFVFTAIYLVTLIIAVAYILYQDYSLSNPETII